MLHVAELTVNRPSHLGGGSWELRGLQDITVIFARNGTGKSQLLRAIRDQAPTSRHYVSPERGGEIQVNPSLAQEDLDPVRRGSRRQSNWASNYRDESVSRIQTYLTKRGAHAGEAPIPPSLVETFIADLLPDFVFEITAGNPVYTLRHQTIAPGGEQIDQPVTNVASLSSGEAALFSMAVDLLTMCAIWELDETEERLLLIDEADLHLHPDLQHAIARFFKRLVTGFNVQILLATHSTTLVAALGLQSPGESCVGMIYLSNERETQAAKPFDKTLQDLATCLGGHAMLGPLFGAPLLLVEGDDDYRVWAQAVRHHTLRVAVIPCDGDSIGRYATTLEDLFGAIHGLAQQPSGFMIRDRDDTRPTKKPKLGKPRHVLRLKLACHELENLYLTDDMLGVLETDWPQARELIRERASEFGEKAAALVRIADSERLDVDLKGAIALLAQLLDPKRVDWRDRLGRLIGRGRPEGQLAEFLGPEVVDALWPDVALNSAPG